MSPSLVHVTKGSGSPLTSHVKIAKSLAAIMVLSGRSWMKGVPKSVGEYRYKAAGISWANLLLGHLKTLYTGTKLGTRSLLHTFCVGSTALYPRFAIVSVCSVY